MEEYILSFITAVFGFFFLVMFFMTLDMLEIADTIAMRLGVLLLLFLTPTIAVGLFSLSFYTLFLT